MMLRTFCFRVTNSLLLSAALFAQTSPIPTGGSATLWSGTYAKDPVKMLLVRNGASIKGWTWNLCTQNPMFRGTALQFIGTIDNSSFQIETEGGCKIQGTATEKSLVGTNFSLSLTGNTDSSVFPPPLPPTSSDWNVFVGHFKAAVQRQDRMALAQMSSPHFQLDIEATPQPGDPLHGVSPGLWSELSKALTHPMIPRPHKLFHFESDSRFAYTCLKCSEQGNVDFMKGLDGQWRWNGLFYSD